MDNTVDPQTPRRGFPSKWSEVVRTIFGQKWSKVASLGPLLAHFGPLCWEFLTKWSEVVRSGPKMPKKEVYLPLRHARRPGRSHTLRLHHGFHRTSSERISAGHGGSQDGCRQTLRIGVRQRLVHAHSLMKASSASHVTSALGA